MKTFELPAGKCLYFEGVRPLEDLYGIVYAEIVAPTTGPASHVPVLLVKGFLNKFLGKRTIAPLGT